MVPRRERPAEIRRGGRPFATTARSCGLATSSLSALPYPYGAAVAGDPWDPRSVSGTEAASAAGGQTRRSARSRRRSARLPACCLSQCPPASPTSWSGRALWRNDGSCIRPRPEYRDHLWSYDFVHDRTHAGRPLRMLTILDRYTLMGIDLKDKIDLLCWLEESAPHPNGLCLPRPFPWPWRRRDEPGTKSGVTSITGNLGLPGLTRPDSALSLLPWCQALGRPHRDRDRLRSRTRSLPKSARRSFSGANSPASPRH